MTDIQKRMMDIKKMAIVSKINGDRNQQIHQ